MTKLSGQSFHLLLRSLSLFAPLDDAAIEDIAAHFHPVRVSRNQFLFLFGDDSDSFFIQVTGATRLERPTDEGRTIIIKIVRPGEIFGEMAALDGMPRSAGAVAHEDSTLLEMKEKDFEALMLRHPQVALQLARYMAGIVRDTTYRMQMDIEKTLDQRLSYILISLADAFGRCREDGVHIELPMTQEILGQMSDASRESVSRLMSQWTDRQIVSKTGKHICILDQDRLKRIADGDD